MAIRKKCCRVPWNKGRIVGQKAPLKLREIWAIRVRLQLRGKLRDLALFNLAIDSKLRACDLLRLRMPTLRTRTRSVRELSLCNARHGDRCDSK